MLEQLKEVIKNLMPEVDTTNVTEDTNLIADLHFDSLGMMMLAMEIEEKFNVHFDEAVSFEKVSDVIAYIESHK